MKITLDAVLYAGQPSEISTRLRETGLWRFPRKSFEGATLAIFGQRISGSMADSATRMRRKA